MNHTTTRFFLVGICSALAGCADAIELGHTGDAGNGGDAGLLDHIAPPDASGDAGVDATVVASSQVPDYIAVDANNVYWADRGTIYGRAKSGGAPWTLATMGVSFKGPPSVLQLDVVGSNVYFTAPVNAPPIVTEVRSVPTSGGTATSIAPASTIACFTISGNDLYYAEQFTSDTLGGSIYQTNITGGAAVRVLAEPSSTLTTDDARVTPLGLVFDGAAAYWMNIGPINSSSATWGVASSALPNGTPSRIGDVTARESGLCKRIAVDDTNVYWARNTPTSALVRAPKSGGPETVLDAIGVADLVLDGPYVYYAASNGTGSIRRVLRAGGTPEILDDDKRVPFDIAVDADSIYWTVLGSLANGQYVGDGAVLRIPKP